MGKPFYLISTSHLEDKIWFQDEQDFIAGMNLVAVAAVVCGVTVLDFILMSNHVHFVVQGTLEEVSRFIECYKQLYSRYSGKRHGTYGLLRRNKADFRTLDDNESVCSAIAYVQMNCVAANICAHPSQYPWGCGSVFFNPCLPNCKLIGDISLRSQYRITHSRVRLPDNYTITEKGVISPASYVPISFVESLFRTPNRFQYYLSKSSKARKRLSNEAMPSFRDQIILAGLSDLCYSLYKKNGMKELSEVEKGEILRQLRYRFSADVAQLSRVTGIQYPDACRLLDSF
ncbi:MAG: hypothetical protein II891_00705 [Bacteroidales bacterium]|nr:hypothetical protein [Bacteroidales bacterium]